jgi:hypothetical protein
MRKTPWKAIRIVVIKFVTVKTTDWIELLYNAREPREVDEDWRIMTNGICAIAT